MLETFYPREYCFSVRYSLLLDLPFFLFWLSISNVLKVRGWKFATQETPLRVLWGFILRSCPILGGVNSREGWRERVPGWTSPGPEVLGWLVHRRELAWSRSVVFGCVCGDLIQTKHPVLWIMGRGETLDLSTFIQIFISNLKNNSGTFKLHKYPYCLNGNETKWLFTVYHPNQV